MKILVPGNVDLLKNAKQFRCDVCGCIWVANNEEYNTDFSTKNETYYICDCPTCGKTAYVCGI